MRNNHLLLLIAVALLFSSCRKDPDPVPTPGNARQIMIQVHNFAGNNPLKLQTDTFQNALGESFTVDVYKYYLSNFILHMKDSSGVYAENYSYHLIDESDPNTMTFELPNVPQVAYDSITFMIGVDAYSNQNGAQTGDLSPTKGMFWTWNTGYIMAKMEGISPQSGAPNKALSLHIGGFQPPYDAVKQLSFALPKNIGNTGMTDVVVLHNDITEWFKTPTLISFDTTYAIGMTGAAAKQIADNYADMISVHEVLNTIP